MAKEYLPSVQRGSRRGDPDLSKIAELAPTGSQQLIFAEYQPGLVLNMSGKGKKSWAIQGRINGKSRRIQLAEWGTEVDELLSRWRIAREALQAGGDPRSALTAASGHAAGTVLFNHSKSRSI